MWHFVYIHDPDLTSPSDRNRKLNISKNAYLINYIRYLHNIYIILKIYHYITFHTQTMTLI